MRSVTGTTTTEEEDFGVVAELDVAVAELDFGVVAEEEVGAGPSPLLIAVMEAPLQRTSST
jgi:hypothetical protein